MTKTAKLVKFHQKNTYKQIQHVQTPNPWNIMFNVSREVHRKSGEVTQNNNNSLFNKVQSKSLLQGVTDLT